MNIRFDLCEPEKFQKILLKHVKIRFVTILRNVNIPKYSHIGSNIDVNSLKSCYFDSHIETGETACKISSRNNTGKVLTRFTADTLPATVPWFTTVCADCLLYP